MEIITVLSILSAILVVTSTSTVYSVLWLVGTFILTSILLGLLNLGFPSLLYVIVYVGAIAILFLFVVQLLDLGNEDASVSSKSENSNTLALAVLFATGLSTLIILATTQTDLNLDNIFYTTQNFTKDNLISLVTLDKDLFSLLVSNSGDSMQVSSLGEWLYGPGLLPLIVVSIILLVSMVAPISLCKD